MADHSRVAAAAVLTGLILTGSTAPAAAHEGNVGFSEIRVEDEAIDYTLWLDVRHLVSEVPVSATGDVAIVDGPDGHDLHVTVTDLTDLVERAIEVSDGAGTGVAAEVVGITTSDVQDLDHLGGVAMMDPTPLLELHLRFPFSDPIETYRIEYDLFLPEEGQEPHSNLAWVERDGAVGFFIFAPGGPSLVPELLESIEHDLPRTSPGIPVPVVAAGAAGATLVAVLGVFGFGRWRARRDRP